VVSCQWSVVGVRLPIFTNGAIPPTGPLQIKHLRSAKCKKWCRNGSQICVGSNRPHNRLGFAKPTQSAAWSRAQNSLQKKALDTVRYR